MTTPSPNEKKDRTPDKPGARNDYGIDPKGELPVGTEGQPGGGDTVENEADNADASTAEGNAFSPNFEPEQDEEKLNKPKDADIDTSSG